MPNRCEKRRTNYPARGGKLAKMWTTSRAGGPSMERDVKNEGASGDVHENKGMAKSPGAKRQEERPVQEVITRRRARGGEDSNF